MFSQGTGNERLDRHHSFVSLLSSGSTHSLNPTQGQSSPFLPSYLLGDIQSHNYSVSSPRLWTSGTNYGSAQTAGSNSGSVSVNVQGPDVLRRDTGKGNVGGPPVYGLFSSPTLHDTLYNDMSGYRRSKSSPALKKTVVSPNIGLLPMTGGSQGNTNLEVLHHRQGVSLSQSQTDPYYTQGDLNASDVLDETWVTVFGFPPGASSYILQQFSQYGTIIKHIIISECNWMHVHYMTRIQAKKALSKDGRIFGGCMKIGVVPCTEKSVMEERNRHSLDTMTTSTSDTGFGSQTPLRPLTAAYVATRSDYEIVRGKPVPRRDGSLVSRLKDYMFGY